MLNFLRFDLAKMFRTKSFNIIVFGFVLLSLILFAFNYHFNISRSYEDYVNFYESHQDVYENSSDLEIDEDNFFLSITPPDEFMDEEAYESEKEAEKQFYRLDIATLDVLRYLALLAWPIFGLLLANDFSTGYLKNLLTIRQARTKWLNSKLGLALFYNLLVTGLSLIYGLITSFVVDLSLAGIDWGNFIGQILSYNLQVLVIAMVVSCLVLWSQSKALTLSLSILFLMGAHHLIALMVSDWIRIDISRFIYSIAQSHLDFSNQASVWSVFLLGLLTTLIFYLINRYRVQSMDFKL